MFAEETIKCLLLAQQELATLNARVIDTENSVHVIKRLCAHVCELLDLRGDVLDLVVCESQVKLLYTRLDGVPSSQTVPENGMNMDILRR